MKKRSPPSKEFLLEMAEVQFVYGEEKTSWEYLICWGFYEMYVEGWWQE
jgi:hypothetical protein